MIANRRRRGDNLTQEFELLAGKIGLQIGQAGDVAARTCQARHQARNDRIGCHRKHDRDDRCGLLYRVGGGSVGDDGVDLEADKLGRDLGGSLGAPLCPAILDRDCATLDPAECAQALHKSSSPRIPDSRVRAQEPDRRQFCRRLGTNGERPSRRAPEDAEKFPPLHSAPGFRMQIVAVRAATLKEAVAAPDTEMSALPRLAALQRTFRNRHM